MAHITGPPPRGLAAEWAYRWSQAHGTAYATYARLAGNRVGTGGQLCSPSRLHTHTTPDTESPAVEAPSRSIAVLGHIQSSLANSKPFANAASLLKFLCLLNLHAEGVQANLSRGYIIRWVYNLNRTEPVPQAPCAARMDETR